MTFLLRLLISALALIAITYVVPGITVSGIYAAVIAALLLGILNAIVKPILVFLTLPITILTLGLFLFVINAALFLFVASFVDGFDVNGFLPALFGSFLMSIIGGLVNRFVD